MWVLDSGILAIVPRRDPYAHLTTTVAGPERDLIDTCQSTRQRRFKNASAIIRVSDHLHPNMPIDRHQRWFGSHLINMHMKEG